MAVRKINVRGEVYERLVELQKSLGATSISDVILHLLEEYERCSSLRAEIERLRGEVERLTLHVYTLTRLLGGGER